MYTKQRQDTDVCVCVCARVRVRAVLEIQRPPAHWDQSGTGGQRDPARQRPVHRGEHWPRVLLAHQLGGGKTPEAIKTRSLTSISFHFHNSLILKLLPSESFDWPGLLPTWTNHWADNDPTRAVAHCSCFLSRWIVFVIFVLGLCRWTMMADWHHDGEPPSWCHAPLVRHTLIL